jgi:hypothetical protein
MRMAPTQNQCSRENRLREPRRLHLPREHRPGVVGDGTPSRLLALRDHQPSMDGRRDAQTPPIHRELGLVAQGGFRCYAQAPRFDIARNRSRPLFAQSSPKVRPPGVHRPEVRPASTPRRTKSPSPSQDRPKSRPASHAQEDRPRVAQSITPSPRSDRPTKSRRPRLSPSPRPHSSPERTLNRPRSPRIAQEKRPTAGGIAHLRRFSFSDSIMTRLGLLISRRCTGADVRSG